MIKEYYTIETHEQDWNGWNFHPIERAYDTQQLIEKIYEMLSYYKEHQKEYYKIYSMDIIYHRRNLLFGKFELKHEHKRVFHWDCYKKNRVNFG